MKFNRKNTIFILVMLMVLVFVSLTITYAKYVYNSTWDYYLQSRGFYFESDELSVNTTKNTNLQWDGSNIPFSIKNNLNNEVVTNYDISYRITCTVEGEASGYTQCEINDSGKNTFEGNLSGYETCVNNNIDSVNVDGYGKTECELGGYHWIEEPSIKDLYFNVVLLDQTKTISDATVKVTAESISPYKQELAGEFILHKINLNDGEIIKSYKNHHTYDRLVLSNSYDTSKCLLVSWNSSNLRIDEEQDKFIDYAIDDNDYINQFKVEINSRENLSYMFYKTDITKNYSINDINIEEIESCK